MFLINYFYRSFTVLLSDVRNPMPYVTDVWSKGCLMILMPYVSYVYIMNVLLVWSYISDVETLALAYILYLMPYVSMITLFFVFRY